MAGPRTPEGMHDAIVRNLAKRTGRGLDAWVALLKRDGPPGAPQRIAWLRNEHGLGGTTARVITAASEGRRFAAEYDDQAGLLERLYSGPRKALRPVYDRLALLAQTLGEDVNLSHRKTYTSISRNRQFAVIKPTTIKRVDLGLALGDEPVTRRLLPAKDLGGGDRNTRRIALASAAEVDDEVRSWLVRACEYGG